MYPIYSHSRTGVLKHVCSLGGDIDRCITDYNQPGNAEKFEENAQSLEYKAPLYCAQMLAGMLVHSRKQAKILDIASGPGQVGRELNKVGFDHVHAHDGSWAMLEVCRQKDIYKEFICCVIDDDNGLPVKDGFYDAVITSGAVLEHHLPVTSQTEFVRVTKPGGHCVIAYSSDVLNTDYGQSWEKESRRLETDGVWKTHCKMVIPDYYINMTGVIDVFQVL
ncbi:unnamed protein product [Lymnaea stagnalis]|uniref:Methyltransferase type 11 domain-containing protein n=1 Tax=Lymnaea stagnalis TaxID=6523 RepID=A0AAV2I9M1_LYMST